MKWYLEVFCEIVLEDTIDAKCNIFLPLQHFTAKISRYIDLSIDTSVYHYILVPHIVHWKQTSRRLGNSVVTGGTVSCHYDN